MPVRALLIGYQDLPSSRIDTYQMPQRCLFGDGKGLPSLVFQKAQALCSPKYLGSLDLKRSSFVFLGWVKVATKWDLEEPKREKGSCSSRGSWSFKRASGGDKCPRGMTHCLEMTVLVLFLIICLLFLAFDYFWPGLLKQILAVECRGERFPFTAR